MTTEIARREFTAPARAAAPAPAAARDPIDNLMRYAAAIETAYSFAEKLCSTDLVPKTYKGKAADGAVAILHGAELGLNPIQALQQIFPVHGTPSMYAKTKVALLKARGYKFKTIETGPERVTYSGWWPGEEPEISTWTIERAREAKFVPEIDPKTGEFKKNQYGKIIGNEKYLTQPEEMLWAKAASTVCGRLAPDVLMGIATSEDIEYEPEPAAAPVRAAAERVGATAAEILAEATPAASDEGEKQDIPQASDAGLESPAGPALSPGDDQAAGLETRKLTPGQRKTLLALLVARGITTRADQYRHMSERTGRNITSAGDLTFDEAAALIGELERSAPEPAESSVPPVEDREVPPPDRAPAPTDQQLKELRAALAAEGLRTDAEQVAYLTGQFGRVIGALFDLSGDECARLTHYLVTGEQGGDPQLTIGEGA